MTRLKGLGILVMSFTLLLPSLGKAAEGEVSQPVPSQGIDKADIGPLPNPTTPLYRAPKGSVPGGRLKGGSRAGKDFPVIQVLAPNHVGLTRQRQPILYWYISKVTKYPVDFTLVDSRAMEPILEIRLRPPTTAGVQHIRLKDHGVSLEAGVTYRWFVTLVIDPLNPSKDIVAGAVIERVEYLESLLIFEEDPARLANAGLWYDAIRKVSELIEANPDDPFPGMQRAQLLSEIGLPEIAESDLRRHRKH